MIRPRPMLAFALSVLFAGLWLGQVLGFYTLIELMDRPDHELLTWILIPFCLFFLVYGLFHLSRRLIIQDGKLVIAHWFRRKQIRLEHIGAISIHYRQRGRYFQSLLDVWRHEDTSTPLASIDLAHFPRASLRELVEGLDHSCPRLKVDREVKRYIGSLPQA